MKYELIKTDFKVVFGVKLFRIKYIKDFGNIKAGELGGYIEKKDNLSQNGDAWVYGNAQVYGNARVYGDAWVYDNAQVSGNAQVLQGYVKLSLENKHFSLMAQLGVCLINKEVILYKRVNKISTGKYTSCYDTTFIYEDKKVAEVENADLSDTSCSTGIHLSNATYWNEGDTLIACRVKEEDIITIQQGKVRVKKCLVLGEVKV